MVAQGEAQAEGQAKPWVRVWRSPKPWKGDRNLRETFCRPSGASSPFAWLSQGLLAKPRCTLGYHRSPLRG
jgi:hypothetical protein